MRAAERARRETEFSRPVQRILELCAAEAKDDKPEINTVAAREFTAWCRERGEMLPVPGRTAAGYLIERLLEDTSMSDLRRAADAIRHLHVVGEWFLDPRPIKAALRFAELTHGFASGGPDDPGGGQVIPIPKSPSPPASDHAEPMPLAAAGA